MDTTFIALVVVLCIYVLMEFVYSCMRIYVYLKRIEVNHQQFIQIYGRITWFICKITLMLIFAPLDIFSRWNIMFKKK